MWITIQDKLVNTNHFDEIDRESNQIKLHFISGFVRTFTFKTKEEAKEEFKRIEKILTQRI